MERENIFSVLLGLIGRELKIKRTKQNERLTRVESRFNHMHSSWQLPDKYY